MKQNCQSTFFEWANSSLMFLQYEYLDFAERQAEREQPMTMNDWANYLDRILTMSGEQLLQGAGSVSHAEAMEHATNEYRKYKQRTISDVEQDYLEAIKRIGKSGK